MSGICSIAVLMTMSTNIQISKIPNTQYALKDSRESHIFLFKSALRRLGDQHECLSPGLCGSILIVVQVGCYTIGQGSSL